MAKTISNLLVGVGFSLDKRSTNKVASGIDSVKNKALQLGSIVAGAFGIKALTSDFASAKDQLGKFAEVFGSNANDINAMGNAMRLEGGTLQSFMSQLSNFERFRAGFRVGDIGFLPDAEKAGIDTSAILGATDAVEAMLSLANVMQQLPPQARLNVADAVGLDDAAIRTLSKGRKELESIIAQQKIMRPITQAMTDSSAEFNESFQNLGTNIGGFSDSLSKNILPAITKIINATNDWTEANRGVVNSFSQGFFNSIEKATEERALEVGAVLALLGGGVAAGVGGAALTGTGAALGIGGIATAGLLSGVLGKLLLVAGLVGGGLLAVEQLNDDDEGGTKVDLNEKAGVILRLLGIDDGQDKVKQNIQLKQSQIRDKSQRPIRIENNVNLDGKLIKKTVTDVIGEEAGKAVEDITSSEGG